MKEVRPSTIQTENSMEFMTQAIGPLQFHSLFSWLIVHACHTGPARGPFRGPGLDLTKGVPQRLSWHS